MMNFFVVNFGLASDFLLSSVQVIYKNDPSSHGGRGQVTHRTWQKIVSLDFPSFPQISQIFTYFSRFAWAQSDGRVPGRPTVWNALWYAQKTVTLKFTLVHAQWQSGANLRRPYGVGRTDWPLAGWLGEWIDIKASDEANRLFLFPKLLESRCSLGVGASYQDVYLWHLFKSIDCQSACSLNQGAL